MTKADNLLIHVNDGLTSKKVIHNCAILSRKGKIFAIGGASSFSDYHFDYHNHATILHAVKSINGKLEKDPSFKMITFEKF